MKKALVLLLILAVAGGIFAQEDGELTWSGDVRSGVSLRFGDTGVTEVDGAGDATADSAYVIADDDDDDRYVKANLTALYEGEGFGLKLGIAGHYTGQIDVAEPDYGAQRNKGGMSFTNAYAWLNFGELVKVSAGMIDDSVWGVGGWVDYNEDCDIGVRVEVTPMEGLNLGVKFEYPNGGGFASSIGDWFLETVIGAKYDTDAFVVDFFVKLFSHESEESSTNSDGEDATDIHIGAGFGLKMIENLDVYLGFAFKDLMGEEDVFIALGQNVSYQVSDALKVGLEAGEELCDGLQLVEIKPFLEFALNDAFTLGFSIKLALENNAADEFGFALVNPNLWGKYTIGGGWIKAAYDLALRTADYGDTVKHKIGVFVGASF